MRLSSVYYEKGRKPKLSFLFSRFLIYGVSCLFQLVRVPFFLWMKNY